MMNSSDMPTHSDSPKDREPRARYPSIGFVILSHRPPDQLLRLVTTLGRMFDDPPIVCHHDFRKCRLDQRQFPGYVTFVPRPVRTAWGEFSLVKAELLSLRFLYEQVADVDWCVLLSAQDYPVRPAEQILQELARDEYDAYIRCELLRPDAPRNRWQAHCIGRYFHTPVKLPVIDRSGRPRLRRLKLPRSISRPFVPFTESFQCYVGGQWFIANRRAVHVMLRDDQQSRRLRAHYKRVHCADESYLQCLLGNEPGLRISGNARRYIDWRGCGANPNVLTLEDLPRIMDSDAFFARKVEAGRSDELLAALDPQIMPASCQMPKADAAAALDQRLKGADHV